MRSFSRLARWWLFDYDEWEDSGWEQSSEDVALKICMIWLSVLIFYIGATEQDSQNWKRLFAKISGIFKVRSGEKQI